AGCPRDAWSAPWPRRVCRLWRRCRRGRLADGPALAHAQTKALLTAELDMPLAAAIELDASTQALLMTGEDYTEFHAAFTEKRPPKWQGR
ncbi:hypothetical protein ACWDVV_23535, partial [Streptomyces tendae]